MNASREDKIDASIALGMALDEARKFAYDESAEAQAAFRAKHSLSEFDWQLSQRYMRRERLNEARKREDGHFDRLKERVSEPIIQEFLNSQFEGSSDKEKRFIREQIKLELECGEDVYYEYSVHDMVVGGVEGVRGKLRRKPLRHLSHSWEAVKGLIGVVAAVAIFAILDTPFEIIAASLLLLLYTGLNRVGWAIHLTSLASNQVAFARFIQLRRLRGSMPSGEELHAYSELIKNAEKLTVRRLVADVGYSLVNLLAFLNLLRAVM